jgi:hypothetical protein
MSEGEYIQIEDEEGVSSCTNSLTEICDDVVESTTRLAVLVKEKHKLFVEAKVLSTSLINELHALNKYMLKSTAPKGILKRSVSKKVKVNKKVVRKKAVNKNVSKKSSSKNSMKALQANLKKINRALK